VPAALITGANGYIGSHMCDAFLGAGYRVFALVRKSSDLRFLQGSPAMLLYGDLTDIAGIDFPSAVDVVVHAAALVSDNAGERLCKRHIYDITVNLVSLVLRRYPRLQRFIHISTSLVLGCCADGISEANPGRPAMYVPYNRMKKQTEEYLFDRWRDQGLPLTILRPADVYGPRDRTSCELMLRAAERGTPLIVGSGRKKFAMCYTGNLCRAALAAAERSNGNGKAYTVCNAVSPTWREFFGALQEGVGRRQRVYVPVSPVLALALFFELLKRLLPGFRPPINYYRIRRITCQTTYDVSKTLEELGYPSDEDYQRQFRSIVEWYREEKRRSARDRARDRRRGPWSRRDGP